VQRRPVGIDPLSVPRHTIDGSSAGFDRRFLLAFSGYGTTSRRFLLPSPLGRQSTTVRLCAESPSPGKAPAVRAVERSTLAGCAVLELGHGHAFRGIGDVLVNRGGDDPVGHFVEVFSKYRRQLLELGPQGFVHEAS